LGTAKEQLGIFFSGLCRGLERVGDETRESESNSARERPLCSTTLSLHRTQGAREQKTWSSAKVESWRYRTRTQFVMDQDFHYYGTYYAARVGGYEKADATLIGLAANFIDFLHEGTYAGYWNLVRQKKTSSGNSTTPDFSLVAQLNNPRYTFQAGKLSAGTAPEDGLWCSYHFTPGNYQAPENSHSTRDVHGDAVAAKLPGHELRIVDTSCRDKGALLNRPQSALSRALVHDAIRCAQDDGRLEEILARAIGGWELLRAPNKADCIKRFRLILLGVRAHVIADTWAHQDFSGISHKMNTYWDVQNSSWGRQRISYQDTDAWHDVILSMNSHENLQAVPSGTSYLGHGWMGHFPDYSFVSFRYRPCWRPKSHGILERKNPEQYTHATLELSSLMSRSLGRDLIPNSVEAKLALARAAFAAPCRIADTNVTPRAFSSKAWLSACDAAGYGPPTYVIDAAIEPDSKAVLSGQVGKSTSSNTRYGTITVVATSNLYLFQIAADYHFHFVRHWLSTRGIMEFSGSWSQQLGPLPHLITDLFD
jgi:hypothetical protein